MNSIIGIESHDERRADLTHTLKSDGQLHELVADTGRFAPHTGWSEVHLEELKPVIGWKRWAIVPNNDDANSFVVGLAKNRTERPFQQSARLFPIRRNGLRNQGV